METKHKRTQVNDVFKLADAVRRRTMPRAEKTQLDIIDAAGPLFAEQGYKATTIAQICKASRANQAAVSFHFGGKEQLYVALVHRAYQIGLEQVPLPQWEPGTPAPQRLHDFVLAFLRRCIADREPRWPCQLIMREVIEPTAACEDFVEGYVRPNLGLLQTILTDLLPVGFPESRLRLIAGSIIGQCLHYRVARHVIRLIEHQEVRYDEEHLQGLADHITAFTLAALGAGPALSV
jgi:AcrR family transcriptional regulator